MNSRTIQSFLRKSARQASVLVVAALLLAACAPAANQPAAALAATSAPAATQPAAPEATSTSSAAALPATGKEAVINIATDPKLGPILVDGSGMTLYMYTKDGPNQSTCTGKCIEAWPALVTQGNPTLGKGVDVSLVGSAPLPDGTMIVTYNKMPLYTYVKDKKAGDVTGQGSRDVWYVVSPSGEAVGYTAPGSTEPAATEAVSTTNEAVINVATDAKLGQILVDGNGMTLYMFTKDGPNQSNCTGQCIDAWPALVTQGHPTLGDGVDASLVGTAPLPDGTMIVTYNKMPLYTYVKDKKPGDVVGQGSRDVWYVVSPSGEAVGYTPPAATPSSY